MVFVDEMNMAIVNVHKDNELLFRLVLMDESLPPLSGSRLGLERTYRYTVVPADLCPSNVITLIWRAVQIGRTTGKADGYEWNLACDP